MDLHEHLRELVARQGPGVVESAELFRAALDDYLTEDEATTGELNLLVDAVRLGAVERLGSILDHGAEPQGAVAEAGDSFARDRGTDDAPRCRWAVAVVGYALGRLEAGDVPAPTGVPVDPPSPPSEPAPSRPAPPVTAATPRTFPATEDLVPPLPLPPPAVGKPRTRGRVVLVALLVAAAVAGAVLAGVWLGSRGDDPDGSADDDGRFGRLSDLDSDDASDGPVEGTLSEDTVLVPVTDDQDVTRIFAVDVETGDWVAMTEGPDDRVPAVSPDRTTLVYSELTPRGGFRPMVKELGSGEVRRLFVTTGGCDYSARPGFDPAGDRLALFCTDELGGYTAAYVVNLRGRFAGNLPVVGEPQGTPTWIADDSVVFAQLGATESEPMTLWEADVDGAEARPLTDGSAGWDSHPDWSDEAGLLLFSRHDGSSPFGDLLTMDAAGEPGPSAEGVSWGHPAWSPDGSRVVFIVKDDGAERLAVAPIADLTDVTYLPEPPGELGVPAWGTR